MNIVQKHILDIPADEYHQDARDGRFLSSHLLADFISCPELYHRKLTGRIREADSPAYAIGRATHCLILEGPGAFAARYLVSNGPVNPRTGSPYGRQTAAFREWVEAQDKEIIDEEDYGFICKLQASVSRHAGAAVLLGEGLAEGTVRAQYCGMPCQIRMDWFSPSSGIVDLKTCSDLRFFEHDFVALGYTRQMAFYQAVLKAATGEDAPVHVIAVEKKEPYRCGVWLLDCASAWRTTRGRRATRRYGS